MAAFENTSGRTLRVEVDTIEVTTNLPPTVPDPAWFERDDHAHEHRFIDGKLPTLRLEVVDSRDSDGEEYTDHFYYCVLCGDGVTPRWKIDPDWNPGYRHFIPGLTHYYIDGYEVSKAEADAFAAEQQA